MSCGNIERGITLNCIARRKLTRKYSVKFSTFEPFNIYIKLAKGLELKGLLQEYG